MLSSNHFIYDYDGVIDDDKVMGSVIVNSVFDGAAMETENGNSVVDGAVNGNICAEQVTENAIEHDFPDIYLLHFQVIGNDKYHELLVLLLRVLRIVAQ